MMRFIRPVLRSCGIVIAPASVICPEHMKTVSIDRDGRARIDVRETLVFLQSPHAGDLSDTCTLEPGAALATFIRQSPDAVDTGQRFLGRSTVEVAWKPKEPVVPYALYDHQYSWFPPGSHSQPALFAEFRCDKKMGNFVFEMITPQAFETAVAFPRPGWQHMRSERTLIKYALKKLDAGAAERPAISDNGERVQWRIVGPRVGATYVCVVFHRYGVALWQDELKKGTLRHKFNELMGRFAPTQAS
jgi:hypothetical protein